MIYNAQKKNLIFISFAIFCAITISIFSYFYFTSDYKNIEIELNNKNNLKFIDTLDRDINTIKNITKDYSKWDDTYSYVLGENDKYLSSNFRENTSALEDLELDFLLIQDINNKLLFSLKTKKNKNLDLNKLSELINVKFNKIKNIATVIEYNNFLYIIVKEEISNSDFTKKPNGYFYFSRKITSKFLSEFNAFIFNVINIKNSNLKNKQMILLKSKKFKKVINSYEFRKRYIYNELHFFNNEMYSFSIETKNYYQILLKAKQKVLIYNIIILLMLLLVFFLIYKYQKFLNINKRQLEKLVSFKTMQISKTLNELEDLNTKLYKLAHTD